MLCATMPVGCDMPALTRPLDADRRLDDGSPKRGLYIGRVVPGSLSVAVDSRSPCLGFVLCKHSIRRRVVLIAFVSVLDFR
jgi:hypothetical protein